MMLPTSFPPKRSPIWQVFKPGEAAFVEEVGDGADEIVGEERHSKHVAQIDGLRY